MKKSISSVLSMLIGGVAGAGAVTKISNKKMAEIHAMSEKHLSLFLLMNQWVKVKQDGKNISSYFEKHGYKKIAIYGMSYVVETLVDELKDSSIEIAYGIDQKEKFSYIDVISLDVPLPEVDVIVVTAITYFDEIRDNLSSKVVCPIVSLEDILHEI